MPLIVAGWGSSDPSRQAPATRRIHPALSGVCSLLFSALIGIPLAAAPLAVQTTKDVGVTRDIKVVSSASARALADACIAWAERNRQVVAIAVIDWGGNLIEFHAMDGASTNAIDTALLKAKSALRWRRPTSETNQRVRSGEIAALTFMNDFPQPGGLPLVVEGEIVGAIGVSGADGEKCGQAAIDDVLR